MKQTAMQELKWFVSDGLDNFDESVKVSEIWTKINELLEMEKQQQWKTVLEETPPSDIELLVQSPEGINHLASWREGYSIFTCQEKSESSSHWKWKLI